MTNDRTAKDSHANFDKSNASAELDWIYNFGVPATVKIFMEIKRVGLGYSKTNRNEVVDI